MTSRQLGFIHGLVRGYQSSVSADISRVRPGQVPQVQQKPIPEIQNLGCPVMTIANSELHAHVYVFPHCQYQASLRLVKHEVDIVGGPGGRRD